MKSPVSWLFGIIISVTAAGLSDIGKHEMQPIFDVAHEKICELRQSPKTTYDDSKFVILVSPLAQDDDGTQTRRVEQAFFEARGFEMVPLCQSVRVDMSGTNIQAYDQAVAQAKALIGANHADLLIFGEVIIKDKSIRLWAVNEQGGCSKRLTPFVLENGAMGADFNAFSTGEMIRISTVEIASACNFDDPPDWILFGKRMGKLRAMLDNPPSDLSSEQQVDIADKYISAMNLLFLEDDSPLWLRNAVDVAKRVETVLAPQVDDFHRFVALNADATASTAMAGFLDNSDGLDEAIRKTDLAISASQKLAIKDFTKPSEAYNNRGINHLKLKKYKEAIVDFTHALELARNPHSLGELCNRTDAYRELGDYSSALSDLDLALSDHPNLDFLHKKKAYTLSLMGRMTDAVTEADRAVGLNPHHGNNYFVRGLIYADANDNDRAIADYSKSLLVSPEDTFVLEYRSNAWRLKGDFQKAVVDATSAIAGNPRRASAFNSRALAELSIGDDKEALSDYTQAISLDPSESLYKINRGELHLSLHDYSSAIVDFSSALATVRDYAPLWRKRGRAERELHDYESAISDFKVAYSLEPHDPQDLEERASSQDALRRFGDAISDYSEAIAASPNRGDYFNNRGVTFIRAGRFAEAVADLDNAVRLDPKTIRFQAYRAMAKVKLGDDDGASADLRDASGRSDRTAVDNAVIEAVSGLFDEERGRYSSAQQHFQNALSVKIDGGAVPPFATELLTEAREKAVGTVSGAAL